MMKVLRKKRKGGFTLIELIVVIAILGILAAIAIPRFANVSTEAQASADAATVRTVNSAWALYNADGAPDAWPEGYIANSSGDATSITVNGTTVTFDAANNVWE